MARLFQWEFLGLGTTALVFIGLAYPAKDTAPFRVETRDERWFRDLQSETGRVNARCDAELALNQFHQSLREDLIDGRIGLQKAAVLLWDANEHYPARRRALERNFPAPSPEAIAAGHLIYRVNDQLSTDPVRRQRVVQRLLDEYWRAYGEPPAWLEKSCRTAY